ncbi:hypothetical protein K491DRAFT_468461 [Lophiostoma macrostomum CBS 122681]|uniref:Uncharacterized protein n=1 Tax=Lophiostoma macrostomum CBS 122681 TaxID=1314788 RepID=A0A6A6T5L0_9PLEO|nr:hypothetical protein K491DRAFT_468461 [Lophiostoma macrostomum CBS 122681]
MISGINIVDSPARHATTRLTSGTLDTCRVTRSSHTIPPWIESLPPTPITRQRRHLPKAFTIIFQNGAPPTRKHTSTQSHKLTFRPPPHARANKSAFTTTPPPH